jgi:carbamoyl-phosphate synthase large subunit
MSRTTRVLVTGAGGPAGIAVIRSYLRDPAVDVLAADMDPYASGLYLVEAGRRFLVPAGDADDFVPEILRLCRFEGIDVVVPTVDSELLPLAVRRDELAAIDVRVAVTGAAALVRTLDKLELAEACAGTVATPRTEELSPAAVADSWSFPVIVKPRRGSGSRGVSVVGSVGELAGRADEPGMIVQEYLPGEEYSLDTLATVEGRVVAVVPRARLRVDSGVSVAGRTLHDPELDRLARGAFAALRLSLVANVQCRRDAHGRPKLLEVNPRFPGAMPLTVHSGVDMPRLCLDSVLGKPLPDAVPHQDMLMVRFLDDRFLDPADLVTPKVLVTS